MAVIEFHRMAERYISFVGGIKNRRGFAATVLLTSANYGLNKTNVFLIAPSYKKTPHECKGLHGCFGRGFFEASWARVGGFKGLECVKTSQEWTTYSILHMT